MSDDRVAPLNSLGRRVSKSVVPFDASSCKVGKAWFVPEGYVESGQQRCGGAVNDKERGGYRHCMQVVGNSPNGRCYKHGRHNPGRALTTGSHTKWKESLPERLRARFEDNEDDVNLEGLRHSLNVLWSMIQEKGSLLTEGGSREHLEKINRHLSLVRLAMIGADLPKGLREAVDGLSEVVLAGRLEEARELDLRQMIQEANTVSKTELSRQQLLGKFMPEGQAAALAASTTSACVTVLDRFFTDKDNLASRLSAGEDILGKIKRDIQLEFIRLVGINTGQLDI